MKNGVIWKDVDGNPIQAHGGCIIEHKGVYYWYGEHKGADNNPGTCRVDVIGVSCYSSKDLVNWKYEGLVLESEKDDVNSPLHTSKVLERPKVVYNEKYNNFVLWMHLDSADYNFAGVGVAVCDTPNGKFKFLSAFSPNNSESRDLTIFKDIDGVAYLFHSTDRNRSMSISRLDDTYTKPDGHQVAVMIDQYREAPAIFFSGEFYFMITSGCTGWWANAALYSTCRYINGRWKMVDNPCKGENSEYTYNGQSSYVFEVDGKFYLMLDHWNENNLKESGYSILPIEITGTETIKVQWQDEWNGVC